MHNKIISKMLINKNKNLILFTLKIWINLSG